MAIDYGVLRARFDRAEREKGKSPHLQIRMVDQSGQAWRIAVNVQSGDGSNVVFWVVDPVIGHPILGSLSSATQGFSRPAATSAGALDFVKAPLFEFGLGRVLPPSGSANADDLQDLLTLYLGQCKEANGEIYSFGAKFDENRHLPIDTKFGIPDGLHGVHDIHMNQGNVEPQFLPDNGIFHDGGLILTFPDRVVGLFLAFQGQHVPTDPSGAAGADSKPLSALITGHPGGAPVATPAVYLERALINPAGPDPGRETVVVANCLTKSQSLHGWQLVDRNGNVTKLDVDIPAGASTIVALDGSGVQLGNNGGNLLLNNDEGRQADSVTYSPADAATVDRYVRFSR